MCVCDSSNLCCPAVCPYSQLHHLLMKPLMENRSLLAESLEYSLPSLLAHFLHPSRLPPPPHSPPSTPPPLTPPPPPKFREMGGEVAYASPPSRSARRSLYGAVDGGGEGGLVPETSPRPRRPCISKLLKRTGTVPSRFAQAVALAVQRSQPRPRDQGLHPETEPCTPSCAPSSAPSSTPASNMVRASLPLT